MSMGCLHHNIISRPQITPRIAQRRRQSYRGSGRRVGMSPITVTCVLCFISIIFIISTSTHQIYAGAQGHEGQHHQNNEEAATCSDNDGTCSDAPIVNSDGTITLRTQTYSGANGRYGNKIMYQLSKLQNSAPLREQLEHQRLQPQQTESGVEEIRETVVDISSRLVEDLMELALLHKDEWSQIVLENPLADQVDVESMRVNSYYDYLYANDHFNKAVNAYEVVLDVYRQLWRIMQPGAIGESEEVFFSPYDQEIISAGQSSIYLLLGDMYHQRYLKVQETATSEDYSTAYQYLIESESWCEQSLSILSGINLENNYVLEGIYKEGEEDQYELDHLTVVTEATETMAYTVVRRGVLLVDMYAKGWILDIDGHLQPRAFSEQADDSTELGEGPKRILDRTLSVLSKGKTIYSQLSDNIQHHTDYRLNIADCGNYMGVVHGYLFQWTEAAEELETSMALYDQIFNLYRASMMDVKEIDEVASSLIQTTQSLWEAYLNLPGRMDITKETFRKHLAVRRYFERRVPLQEPLADEDEVEHHHSRNILFHSQDGADSQYEESLMTYQTMLTEYLKQLSEYPPEGSYYDMGFDAGGNVASYVQHDKVYEGSLRSAIGSIQLAKSQVWEARRELELAIGLLREGMHGGRDSFEAYGENGEIIDYSVDLELANALLNLAYALLGLKQWRRSFEAFEEAMDVYASELAEGESPMNHLGLGMDSITEAAKGNKASFGERLTHFIKGSLGIEDDAKSLSGESDEEEKVSSYINLDNYQMMGNITAPGAGIM